MTTEELESNRYILWERVNDINDWWRPHYFETLTELVTLGLINTPSENMRTITKTIRFVAVEMPPP